MAQLPHLKSAVHLIALLISGNPSLADDLRIYGQGMPRGRDGLVAQSEDQQYSLRVVSRFQLPFQYEFRRQKEQLWTKEFDFVPEDAQVTNSGTVVFFGYKSERTKPPQAYFCILDKNGKELIFENWQRNYLTLHSPPVPVVDQLVVDAVNDRVIVRMKVERTDGYATWNSNCCGDPFLGEPSWRIYRLSTGLFLEEFDPDDRYGILGAMRICLAEVRPIPSTPLLVLHYYDNAHCGPRMHDSHLLVVDLPGRVAAHARVSGDYPGLPLGSGNHAPPASYYFGQNPMVFTNETPCQFRVKLFGVPWETTYTMDQTADGSWQLKGIDQVQERKPQP